MTPTVTESRWPYNLPTNSVRTASVTLLSMSPGGSQQGIRQALAMGADGAILIEDESLRGADALTTSQVLAAAATRAEADLVIAGTESTDGYTGVVPQQVAEIMGVPALTFARKVEHVDGKIRIERQTQAGYDVVEGELPAVLSVTSGVVEPRYPTFKGIMQAKSKPVETLTAADLGLRRTFARRSSRWRRSRAGRPVT